MPRRSRLYAVALSLLVLTLVPATAAAQQGGGPIDIQTFRPAVDSKGYITLNASQPLGHLDVSFGLVVNYALNVMSMYSDTSSAGKVWCSPGTAAGTCSVGADGHAPSAYNIENMVSGHFQLALGLFKYFEVGLSMPVTIWTGDTDPDGDLEAGNTGEISGQNAGDLGLHIKGRILNTSKHPVGLGLILSTYFPTGSPDQFMGSGGITIHPSIILDKEFLRGRISMAINVGARIMAGSLRGDATDWKDTRNCLEWDDVSGAVTTTEAECGTGEEIKRSGLLTYGIGGTFAVVPGKFSLVAEIVGQTGFDAFFDAGAFHSAHELLAGFKLYLGRNSYMALGVGRGLRGQDDNHQYGSPDFRVFGAFIFEPSIGDRDGDGLKDDVDKCPDDPEDFDDFEDLDGCPDEDNDRDGLLDEDDKCPNEPEDKDGIDDLDGCPEADILDRDGDGIPDEQDSCPDDPEDKDDFEDKEGCPDPDNDKDKILDVDDLCPNDPEDYDSFEDKNGCPDPDNDKDRILDVDDACPNEPETYNNHKDKDGCPDKGLVVERKGRLEILQKIYFETNKFTIKSESFPVLDAVAVTMKQSPGILLVEIQGHADERDSHLHNQELTDGRSKAVRDYLINKGVEAERLKAKGFGETKPIDKNHNEEAWSKNRRVEFVILKRGSN